MTHLLSMMDNHSISPPSSLNSCSRESEDITSKYHRLANQYAQLRAQVVVLKKGLLDEREKHSFIKDNDVGKGQKIRNLEQEVDSLNFRNKQLSKRVDGLQQELDSAARKKISVANINIFSGKGKQGKGTGDNNSNKEVDSIHYEELESKIRENEMLHSKLQTIESKYTLRLQALEEENASLASAKRHVDSILKASKDEFEMSLSKEQRRSSTLQVQLDKLQKKLDSANTAVQKSRASHSPDQLGDKKSQKCRNLNIYAKDRKRSVIIEQTLGVISCYVTEYVTSLLNYCTYLEQRTQLHSAEVGEALTSTNQNLCTLLVENTTHIRPLLNTFATFVANVQATNYCLKSCTELKMFAEQYSDITGYLVRVFTITKQSLSEECMLMSCSLQMEQSNMVICDTIQPLLLALQNTAFSLGYVAEIGDSGSATQHIPALIGHLKELSGAMRAHLSALHPKLILCHKLPTVTQRLKTTDECCVASLQSFVNTLTKISRNLEDSLPLLTKPSRFSSEQDSIYTSTLTQHCTSYLDHVNSSHAVSPGALLESPEPPLALQSPTPDNSAEINKAKEKISKLEASKEHWMLEAQLLNIKLEKAQKQLREAEQSKVSNSSSPDVPVDTLLDLTDSDSSMKTQLPWDDSGLREEAIRQHYTNRVNNLLDTVQRTDGDCLLFKKECLSLKKRLNVSERQQNQAAIDMGNNDMQKKHLDEELTLTKDKYEAQLALMSEHLCAMNDKIVALDEENQKLKIISTPPQQGRGSKFKR